MTLHPFSGGLKLPESREEAPPLPLLQMPVPQILEFNLQYRDGSLRQPIVQVGEAVERGQPLTASYDQRTPIVASLDGFVSSVGTTITLAPTPQDTAMRSADVDESNQSSDTKDLARQLFQAGIEGHGGAAFCASAKLQALGSKPPECLIINAVECEPLISCDQALIHHDPTGLILGIEALVNVTGAKTCIVAIESNRQTEFDLLSDALRLHPSNRIQIICVPTVYPTGSERQLITVLTGLRLSSSERPSQHGLLCYNVATVFAIKELITNGRVPNQRIVSVTGNALPQPRNVWAFFGTRLSDLIAFVYPDFATKEYSEYELIVGGEMTGQQTSDWQLSVTAATNCIQINQGRPRPKALPCIRCGDCNTVCPERLIPQQLHWYCTTNDIDSAEKFELSACIECGCCDVVCPSRIPLTQTFRDAKRELKEQQRREGLADRAQERSRIRDKRLKRREQARQQRIEARKAEIEKRRATGQSTDAIQAALARAKARKRS